MNKLKEKSVNLLINEDETNYVYFVSNVLNENREITDVLMSQKQFSNDKIHIIYNESNYQDFTKFDKSKIYLVFSKLNET